MEQKGGRDHAALFCDTNVLVRFLTDDPPDQAEAATTALDSGDPIVLTDVVVAELCYVLTSFYRLSVAETADRISRMLAIPSIQVSDENVLLDALNLWATHGIGFPDAYLAALDRASDRTAVLSFDRDFDKIEGVERVDPAQY